MAKKKRISFLLIIVFLLINNLFVSCKTIPVKIILEIYDKDGNDKILDYYSVVEEKYESSKKKTREWYIEVGVTNARGEAVYGTKVTNVFLPEKTEEPEHLVQILLKKQINTTSGSIRGSVTDVNGTPVGYVLVKCVDQNGGITETKTEIDGSYIFSDVPIGEYKIIVEHGKYSSISTANISHEKISVPKIKSIKEVDLDKEMSSLYITWDLVTNATEYIIAVKGTSITNISKENFTTITNLKPNASYIIMLWAKNQNGKSDVFKSELYKIKKDVKKEVVIESPASEIRVTQNKNHLIELRWDNIINNKEIAGYYIKYHVAWDRNKYYITGYGQNIQRKKPVKLFKVDSKIEEVPYIISGIISTIEDGKRIIKYMIDDGIPYNFEIYAADEKGKIVGKPLLKTNVISADTIAPLAPKNFNVIGVDGTKVTFKWERGDFFDESIPIEKLRYHLYYGESADKFTNYIEIDSFLTNREIFLIHDFKDKINVGDYKFSVTAVDDFGNESVYPIQESPASVDAGVQSVINITLEKESKLELKIKPPPSYYYLHWDDLERNGFIVPPGKICEIYEGKYSVKQPVIISRGAKLIINVKAVFIANSKKKIDCFIFKSRATGKINNCEFNGFKNAILSQGGNNISVNNSVFIKCSSGLKLKNSKTDLNNITAKHCGTGISLSGCNGSIRNCNFTANSSYGIDVSNNGNKLLFDKNYISKNKVAGFKINNSTPKIRNCKISENLGNGIYCINNANPEIINCNFENNKKEAVMGGGSISNCFVKGNNGNDSIDNTPDNGVKDFHYNSSSNTMIKQLSHVDMIKGLKLKK